MRWSAHGSPDRIDNGVCLCALHLKLFDKGVGLAEHSRLAMSVHSLTRSPAASTTYSPSRALQSICPTWSDLAHAAWNRDQAFRQPQRLPAP